MKKTMNALIYLTLLLAAIQIVSCDDKVGYATPPKFETKAFNFGAGEVDTVLSAQNKVKWFFDQLHVNGTAVYWNDPTIHYYTSEVPGTADSDLGFIKKFEGEWFAVERLDDQHIRIRLKENTDGKKRTLVFDASVGNATTLLTINQQF